MHNYQKQRPRGAIQTKRYARLENAVDERQYGHERRLRAIASKRKEEGRRSRDRCVE